MEPGWFPKNDLPLDEKWPDEAFWLPPVLDGKKIRARFRFGAGGELFEQEIRVVENFE